jgi:oligosaccharide 4-alpha-D-glucosyltransferase
MKAFFSFPVSLRCLAGALLLLASAAQAQRAEGGRPEQDPFGWRVMPKGPGGRYRSHSLVTEYRQPSRIRNYNVVVHGVDGKERTYQPAQDSQYARKTLRIKAADGSTLQILPWASGVVKIEYFAPGRKPVADSSISVVQLPQASEHQCRPGCDGSPSKALLARYGPDFCAGIQVTPSTITYSADCFDIIVDKATLGVRVEQISHLSTRNLSVEALSIFSHPAASPAPAAAAAPGGVAARFRLAPGERLYGTGSRALPLDRRGHRLELYNQAHYGSQNNEPNLNIALPTVLSSRGYMLFFDNHAAGYLDLGKTDKDVLEYGGENLTSLSYFVITGRNQAEILARYTALTGRQPLPPRWALGLIQSRFGYKTDAEMLNVAARMRRENFPLDALVLDLYWFGGTTRQGDLSWDKTHFPDPAGLMSSLSKQGVKTVLISEPYVMRTSRNDSTVRTQGLVGTTAAGRPFTVGSFWAGPASILDVFKPQTRDWLWGYYKTLHQQGAAGWWSDLGEPENHPEAMQHVAGPARAVHNAYGQSWAGIFTEGYAKDFPEERVFNLARSGWAGMQRNGVLPWSGDINRSWSGYQAQIPVMLGMGQGGVGYMHSDAGGFCVGGIDPELYTRWLQMASLGPILRPHASDVPPEPYYYPDPYKSSVREAVQLRYRLLPYLYTLAWQNTTTGAPLARSMDFEECYESGVKNDESGAPPSTTRPSAEPLTPSDQYLLGPNLLVAPVLHPSQRRRNVALPGGSWIDFYTNRTYPGGRTVGVPAPLAHAPLLVRAGAFLPMTAYRPSAALFRPDTLLLRYYPDPSSAESEFTMYDDDGHSAQALARRQYETLTARGFCTPTQTDVLLSSNGGFPGQPVFRYLRLLVQRVAAPPTAIFFDEKPVPAEGYSYDPVKHELEVHFLMNAGVAVSLRRLKVLTETAPNSAPETLTLEAPDARSFGPSGTALHYTRHLAGAADAAALRIRNAQGRVVRTLPLEAGAGPHALVWDARDDARQPLPPGVYVAEAGGQHQRLIVTQ